MTEQNILEDDRREGLIGLSNLMGDVMSDLKKITIMAPNGYQTTIEINGYDFDCIVDYEIEPACKGGRGDFGMQTEPDYPAQINMGEVYILDGQWGVVDIPEKAMTDILDEILEHEL